MAYSVSCRHFLTIFLCLPRLKCWNYVNLRIISSSSFGGKWLFPVAPCHCGLCSTGVVMTSTSAWSLLRLSHSWRILLGKGLWDLNLSPLKPEVCQNKEDVAVGMVSSQCLPPLYHRFPWSTSQILLNLDHERSEKGCGNWIWFRWNQWCGHHQEKILVLMVSSFLYFCIGLFYWAPCSCSIWKVFMPIVNSSTGAIFFTIR